MRRPCEETALVLTETGRYKTVKLYSYVVTLTKIDSDEVMAERYDSFANKSDVWNEVVNDYPDWKIKNILKLYDDDFRE